MRSKISSVYRASVFSLVLLLAQPAAAKVTYNTKELLTTGCCSAIAHGGGAIDGNPYMNSIEGLQRAVALGHQFVEMDFMPTSDGQWVGVRTWDQWRAHIRLDRSTPPTFAEFTAYKLHGSKENGTSEKTYTPVTLPGLEKILQQHPRTRIIVDTKSDFAPLFEAFQKSSAKDRFIYQTYTIKDLDDARAHGTKSIFVLTTPNTQDFPGLLKDMAARKKDIAAISVSLKIAYGHDHAQFKELKTLGIPLYIYGPPESINSHEVHETMQGLGANGFFLD